MKPAHTMIVVVVVMTALNMASESFAALSITKTGDRYNDTVAQPRPYKGVDTMAPVVRYHSNPNGTISVTATERRNIPSPKRLTPHDTDQVETGIGMMWFENVRNMRIVGREEPYLFQGVDSTTVILAPIDPELGAVGTLFVEDKAANVTSIDLSINIYSEPSISDVDFGNVRVGSTRQRNVIVIKRSLNPMFVTSVVLTGNARDRASYTIHTKLPRTVEPLSKDTFAVDFVPKEPFDSKPAITVRTNLDTLSSRVTARAVIGQISLVSRNVIATSSFDTCDPAVTIYNVGDDTLTVTRARSSNSRIRVAPIQSPIRIAPQRNHTLRVCYLPTVPSVDSTTIFVYSDSYERNTDSCVVVAMYGTTSVGDEDHRVRNAYPHPVTDVVNIPLPDAVGAIRSYKVSSLQGTVILQSRYDVDGDDSVLTFDVSTIPAGIYVVEIRLDNKVLFTHFVKSP